MSRFGFTVFAILALIVGSTVSACSCSRAGTPTGETVTSNTTTSTGGAAGSTSTQTGSGGVSLWPQGPGTPGSPTLVGKWTDTAGGMSVLRPAPNAQFLMSTCGQGGSGGTAGSAGAAPTQECPTSWVAQTPRFSGTQQGLQVSVAVQPVFQPIAYMGTCPYSKQWITFGSLLIGDCLQVNTIPVFDESDLQLFYQMENVLPIATSLDTYFPSGPISLIAGLSVRTSLAPDGSVLMASNVGDIMINMVPDPVNPGQYVRSNISLARPGMSAMITRPDGTSLLATHRTFTVESWNSMAGSNDPGYLVEQDPIQLVVYDPSTGAFTDFATIPYVTGTARVSCQSSIGATWNGAHIPENITSFYMAGTVNSMALAQDGGVLFVDRLTSTVYHIAPDGSSVANVFEAPVDQMLTGVTQPPNDVIYVTKAPRGDVNCTSTIDNPIIAYWDDSAQQLVDWLTLEDPGFPEIFYAVGKTGVIERNILRGYCYYGGGFYVDLDWTSSSEILATPSILSKTLGIPVLP